MPKPPDISTQLEGVTDPQERGRIKAQGLVAHLTWAEKKLPFTWQTSNGYIIRVDSVEYEDPAFKVVLMAWGPEEVRYDPDTGDPYYINPTIPTDNPFYYVNPPILLGGSLIEDPVAVAKQIIEDAVGVPRAD